ncbi:MAG: alpha/beta fold hydrolase [Candidatus Kaiserbacteria bacterium]|nr:alpha/beta fold hydrolase [Candidatus Kaiserbacteria bacterium]
MHILILHGIGAEAGAHWQRWLGHELEKEGHTVHMPDLPDASHPDRFDWLEYVKGILQDIPPAQLIIVGHSLGVVTALDFIEQSHTKVHGLVSVSGFPRDYGSELNSYFMKEKELDFMIINAMLETAIVWYGDNDPYVPQVTLQSLADELEVTAHVVSRGGHLNTEAGYEVFPALLESIVEICPTNIHLKNHE